MGQISSYCQHLSLERQQRVTAEGRQPPKSSDVRSVTEPDSHMPSGTINSDRSSNNCFVQGLGLSRSNSNLRDTSQLSADSSSSRDALVYGYERDGRSSAILEKSCRISNKDYPLWEEELELDNHLSAGFYVRQTDGPDSLVATDDPRLNCALLSILAHHQRTAAMLVTPQRYIRCTQTLYETKLFVNGAWRVAEVEGRASRWDALSAGALRSLFGSSTLASEEILYRLLAWLPDRLDMAELPDKLLLFHWLKGHWDSGNILVGLTVNGLSLSVLSFETFQMSKYLVVRPGAPSAALSQLLPPSLPPSLQTKGSLVLDWPTLERQRTTIHISWQPSAFPFQKVVHDEHRADKYPTQINNFSSEECSLYWSPQYMLRVGKREEEAELRVFVERHMASAEVEQKVNVLLYPYEGGRRVYVETPIQPVTYSQYAYAVSASYVLAASPTTSEYCLVVTREAAKDASFAYTLAVLSGQEVDVYRLSTPPPSRSLRLHSSFSCGCDSLYASELLQCPMFALTVSSATNLEVRTESQDTSLELMNVVGRLQDDEKAPVVLTTRFAEFAGRVATPGFFYPGLSYSALQVTPGRYLLIVLVRPYDNAKSNKFAVAVRCANNSAATLTEVPPYPRFPHFRQLDNVWVGRVGTTISPDFHSLTLPQEIYEGKHAYLFELPAQQLSFECWLRPTAKPLNNSDPLKIPSIALLVFALVKRGARIAAKRLFFSDWMKTTVGIRTGKLVLDRGSYSYCCVLCLGGTNTPTPYKLEVTATEELTLQPLSEQLRL